MSKTTLLDHIHQKIVESGGKIPFSTYMQLALYTPGLGYYTGGAQKFGCEGDFVTAPELSPIFGKCLAKALRPFNTLLEFGAGSGILAKTLLDTNQNIEKYWILEISSELQHRQQETLKNHLDKVTWLTELPLSFSGAIIANEVIDAFPATKFLYKDNHVYEYYVNEKLEWVLEKPHDPRITEFVKSLDLPSPYTSEMHLWLKPWIKSLSDTLNSGLMLIFDYGFPRHEFYHPDRREGTLMCHYRHQAHTNPFAHPGIEDITAHVDFTAIAEAAVESNLEVAGYTSQAAFLLDCGLTDFIENDNDTLATKILTHPSEMGELFKVIGLTKDWNEPLSCFKMLDRRARL